VDFNVWNSRCNHVAFVFLGPDCCARYLEDSSGVSIIRTFDSHDISIANKRQIALG
jgi:hypothetical protein